MVGSPTLGPTRFSHYIQPRKGAHIIRILAVGIALTIFYVAFASTNFRSEWRLPGHFQSTESQNGFDSVPHLSNGTVAKVGAVSAQPTAESASASVVQSMEDAAVKAQAEKDAAVRAQAEEDAMAMAKAKAEMAAQLDEEKEKLAKQLANAQASQGKPKYYNIHNGLPFNIVEGMQELLAIVPDEIYTRDLLTPITGGGEQRLREVGLRSRMFAKYFATWEALHVVSDASAGSALVRDDVIQYLRDTVDLSAISLLPRAELIRTYEQFRAFLSQFAAVLFPWTEPYFADHMTLHAHSYNAGRGIVISGFDAVAPYIVTAIKTFRRMGCDLPVEIFYLGDKDLGDEFRELLEALPGVITRNLRQMVADRGWEIDGFATKAFSILMSSFREVLFLDADVLFLRNPALLFQDPAYEDTGALFFKDRLVSPSSRKKFLREILPKPVSAKARTSYYWTGESSEMQESGVMLIDKWKHFVSLLVITRMNGPDRNDDGSDKGVYSFFYGDKETFWLGFELAGDTNYNFHQGIDGAMGTVKEIARWKSDDDTSGNDESSQSDSSANEYSKVTTPGGHPINHGGSHRNILGGSSMDGLETSNQGSSDEDNSFSNAKDAQSSYGSSENTDQEHDSPSDHESPVVDSAVDDKQSSNNPSTEEQVESIRGMIDLARENMREDMGTEGTSNEGQDQKLSRRDSNDASSRHRETLGAENYSFDDFNAMDSSVTNFTICSAQLLHLDLEGRPLWFNGWIQEDKFDHNPMVAVSKFEYFLKERRETLIKRKVQGVDGELLEIEDNDPADWALGDHNKCCLTSDRVYKLTEDELQVLDMIVGIARDVGAVR
ncbi:mannosyltransferase putative-domain-containing protein [Delphinella strobiligena]|nr:mannosyltransferase putative-domain-containing protein [Delphinella strobiligena]